LDVVLIGSLAVVSKWGIPEIFWGCAAISLIFCFLSAKKEILSKDEASLEAGGSVEQALEQR
jgi:hypothetical protein